MPRPHLAFAYPAEGFPVLLRLRRHPAREPRARLAHQFLDYLLRPAVSAQIVESTKTATANGAARNLLPEPVRNTPSALSARPTSSSAASGPARCPATQRLRDRIWTEIKSA